MLKKSFFRNKYEAFFEFYLDSIKIISFWRLYMEKNLLQYCTVLYAEDDEITRKSMAKTLSYFFETVILAKNGKEAIENFEKLNPHVVILDIDMPKLNGLEVAEKIRNLDQNIPILILTIHNESEKILKGFEFNAINWLIKPISMDSLITNLEKCKNILIKNSIGFINLDENTKYNSFTKTILHNNDKFVLSFSEALIFEFLLKNRGQIVNQNLLESILFQNNDFSSTGLKNTLYRLKKKLPTIQINCISKTGYILK